MGIEEFVESRQARWQEVSLTLKYGFLADDTLLALGIKKDGKELPKVLADSIDKCRDFLTDLIKVEENYPYSIFTHDRRLFRLLSSGDIHQALGVKVEEKPQFIAKLSEFSQTLQAIQDESQIETEKYRELTRFLNNLGEIQLVKADRLMHRSSC